MLTAIYEDGIITLARLGSWLKDNALRSTLYESNTPQPPVLMTINNEV